MQIFLKCSKTLVTELSLGKALVDRALNCTNDLAGLAC
jgi:hypothetical protein